MQRLKERLVARRNSLGLTQEQLAERADVAERSIASYETGESPTTRQLEKLAKALGVSTIWLMGGDDRDIHRDMPALQETSASYGAQSLDLSSIPRDTLDGLFRSLSDELSKAEQPEREKILRSLTSVHNEIQRRSNPTKGGKSRAGPNNLTPELKDTDQAMESVAHQSALRATRGSKQSSPTGDSTGHKSAAGPGNKPPKPGAPGESTDESGDQSKART